MKKLAFILVLTLLAPNLYAERIALLIGNKHYKASPLSNPLNDVNAMRLKLAQLGFKVTSKNNLNRATMRTVIRNFSARLRKGDMALVYYSGHGAQVKGQNYLIPVNNDIKKEFEISDGAVSLNFLLQNLTHSASKNNIVILDACRDNPFTRSFKSSTRGLARLQQRVGGTFVAFAASTGGVSNDGRGKYGTYTKHLLKHIATPNINLSEMFTNVRRAVSGETKGSQIPMEENALFDTVYLSRKSGGNGHSGDAEKRRQEILRKEQAQRIQQEKIRQQQAQQQLKAQQEKARQQQLRQQGKRVTKTSGRRIGQYIDHGNGTVTDTKTKLMWKKCSEGQIGNNCSGKAKAYTWNDAMKRFKRVSFAGRNDWRLPTRKELRTLVYCANGTPQSQSWDKGCNKNYTNQSVLKPAIHNNVFPNTMNYNPYWSSSFVDYYLVRHVYFANGSNGLNRKNDNNHVRLVRSGQ